MRILVTGGMGFIGSHLIIYLLKNLPEAEIINLDALNYAANPRNGKYAESLFGDRYEFIHGNISDVGLVDTLMHQVDIVFNLAAETHVDRSLQGSSIFMRSNVLGVNVMLQAAHKAWLGHPEKRFIQVSTDEVYGTLALEDKHRFTEQSPLNPRSPYSASKAGGDLLALSYFHSFDLPVIITRASNNYGPRQFPEKFIPTMIMRALLGEDLPIYGDGLYVRDWLYAGDHAEALWQTALKGVPGQIYNIGGNNQINNLTVLKYIMESLGRLLDIDPSVFNELIHHVEDRPGHDRRYDLDCAKIESELGFTPQADFQRCLDYTVKWYYDHFDWWGNNPLQESQLWLRR